MVVGVAELLARRRHRLAGRIAFVFQPADEPMRGAKRMIEDGLLERVEPDMSLAAHVLPMVNAGRAVVQRGPIWASRDELTLHHQRLANPFSDDFGLFMAAAPGCLMLLGTANPDRGISEIWHRPGFDIDEDALPVGVHIMSLAALDLLQ